MRALLLLYRETGNRRYLEPLPRALAYYQRSLLPPTDSPSDARRRACPGGAPCAARFYELKTNRPLYITKGTRVTAEGQGTRTVDGYALSYSDASVITHYAVLVSGAGFSRIAAELAATETAAPAETPPVETPPVETPPAETPPPTETAMAEKPAHTATVRKGTRPRIVKKTEKAPEKTETPAPVVQPATTQPANDCNPPYYYEGQKKVFKPNCL